MPNKSIVRFLKTYYKRNNKLFKEDLEKFYDEFLMTAEGGVEICLALEFGVWYENFNSNKDSMIPLIFELKRNGITDEKTLSWNTLFTKYYISMLSIHSYKELDEKKFNLFWHAKQE